MTAPRATNLKVKFLHNESVEALSRAMYTRVSFNSYGPLMGRSRTSYYKGFRFPDMPAHVDYILYHGLQPIAWHYADVDTWGSSFPNAKELDAEQHRTMMALKRLVA